MPPERARTGGLGWAIGRPRTALFVGTDAGAAEAAERDATVTRSREVEPGAPVDAVVLAGAAASSDLGGSLARARERLVDGGHVVVQPRHEEQRARKADLLAAIERAGFELLWRGGSSPISFFRDGGFGEATVLVARRPPERRRLSLTVGMISMNEAGAVGGVIDAIRAHRPDAEILLVDSSRDATPEIAEAKGARVLRQFPPRGYGPAMTRLLYSATTDVIVTMDCDGTYPTDRIAQLHQRIEDGADLVNASRTHRRPRAMPLANYLANRTFAAVTSIVHGATTTDVHSGMRAYRTSMLRGVYVDERGPALPVELFIVPARRGYRVEDVNIAYLERIGSTTLHRWDSTVWTFRRIARTAIAGDTRIPSPRA